jgi:hypothetical protein
MLGYIGKYRIEGQDFVTHVDASWNQEWNGTEQRRHFRIEGDKLFIEPARAPSIVFPGKADYRRIVGKERSGGPGTRSQEPYARLRREDRA